jgi:alcohol dehydrogenase class IV
MQPFAIEAPPRILFGRGEARKAPSLIAAFGPTGLLVHGAGFARADWLADGLSGTELMRWPCRGEPTLDDLQEALSHARPFAPHWVAALGGGAALDLGKALAALFPAPGDPMDHLEVVGRALPLAAPPLPFIAIPTTAGTGAEVTKNAVITLPRHGRKVSLRDPAMLARLAIVDPALTDHCPRAVTLASGLDALVQIAEPFLSHKATPYTDALVTPLLPHALPALMRLMAQEDPGARDTMALISLTGGLALANAGLGAVHGLAGTLGGRLPAAPHGALCGRLFGPCLAANLAATQGTPFAPRMEHLLTALAPALACPPQDVPRALTAWCDAQGLPRLAALGLAQADIPAVAAASEAASSMKANPVVLPRSALESVLHEAL